MDVNYLTILRWGVNFFLALLTMLKVQSMGNNREWGLTAPFLYCGNYLEAIPDWKAAHTFLLSHIHSHLV
jgi:hypothetical protein